MLKPYQVSAFEFAASRDRTILMMPMGTGKTLTTLSLAVTLDLTEDVFPMLVLAPLRVAKSTWPDEVTKWPHLGHLRVSPVIGNKTERIRALAAPADVYTINYEGVPWLVEHLDGEWPFKMIVADESTKLKGFRARQGAARAKALSMVAFRSRRFLGLTGTPAPNGLQDLWGQFWFVDRGRRLGKTFTAFQNRWFRAERVGGNQFAVKLVPFDHAQSEIESRISDVCFSLVAEDHFDIEKPIETVVRVNIPVMDQYIRMQNEFILEIEHGWVEAVNAATKVQKLLQIANGFVYTDDKGNWEPLHSAKLEALESVIEEAAGAPVLVAYNFKVDLIRLKKWFPQGRAMDTDPKTIADWNAGNIPILFIHPKSAGHGLNLQHGGNILVFFGIDWNLEERLQVIERIGPVRQAQAGYNRPVFIYYIIADGTVDEVVLARVDAKKTILETLMENLKRG